VLQFSEIEALRFGYYSGRKRRLETVLQNLQHQLVDEVYLEVGGTRTNDVGAGTRWSDITCTFIHLVSSTLCELSLCGCKVKASVSLRQASRQRLCLMFNRLHHVSISIQAPCVSLGSYAISWRSSTDTQYRYCISLLNAVHLTFSMASSPHSTTALSLVLWTCARNNVQKQHCTATYATRT